MERVCKKTEFEVEGWRKIAPLIDIIEQDYIPREVQERIKLEMISTVIFEKSVFNSAMRLLDPTQLKIKNSTNTGKSIKDSWIYEHFSKLQNTNEQMNQSKIALYVSTIIPINQNLDASNVNSIGNHCVIASGLAKWPKNDPNRIECLELEIYGDSDEMRYIPVEFPFFEEIQIDINTIYQKSKEMGVEYYNDHMNKLGEKLALTKWKKIEDNWYDLKKRPKEGQEEADKAKQPWKYGMIFVRGIHPCFQLKFTS